MYNIHIRISYIFLCSCSCVPSWTVMYGKFKQKNCFHIDNKGIPEWRYCFRCSMDQIKELESVNDWQKLQYSNSDWMDEKMDGWMDTQMDGWMNEWIDTGWMAGWMDAWTYTGIAGCSITLYLKCNDVYVCFKLCNALVMLCSFGSYWRLYK